MATFEEFMDLDIRVGRVINAEDFPKARKPAYKLTIDFGPLGVKRSSAQVTELYKKEDLVGMEVVCVMNFPPKQVADFVSEVLVLGVYTENGVVLLQPDREVRPGCKIG